MHFTGPGVEPLSVHLDQNEPMISKLLVHNAVRNEHVTAEFKLGGETQMRWTRVPGGEWKQVS